MPKFSIIVPVYNVAPYLRECLDSVLAQTYPNWECICVNDGSTDESGAILDEYAQKDSRFRVFHKKNGGVSSARNLALDNAKGEWVGFLDGDDVWHVDLMRRCEGAMLEFPFAERVRFKYVCFAEKDTCQWPMNAATKMRQINYQSQLYESLFGAILCSFYKGERVKNLRFDTSLILGEDTLWGRIVIERMNSLVDIDSVLYGYRQRIGSAMHSTLSLNKRVSILYSHYANWKVLIESNKLVEHSLMRWYELRLTEAYSHIYFGTLVEKREEIWQKWLDVLKIVGDRGGASKRLKVSAKLVSFTKSKSLAFALFYIPHWLKLHGVHR